MLYYSYRKSLKELMVSTKNRGLLAALLVLVVIVALVFGAGILDGSVEELVEPVLSATPTTEVVVAPPYATEIPATLTPEEVQAAWTMVSDVLAGIDLCKSGYILLTVANLDGMQTDLQKYYQDVMQRNGVQPESAAAVKAHENAQELLGGAYGLCVFAPAMAEIFNAVGEPTAEVTSS